MGSLNPFSSPSAPQTPDPNTLLQQQGQYNRVNETNPFGSSTYSQDPGGQWSRNISLNPALQQQLGNQQSLGAGASGLANSLLNQYSGQIGQPINYGSAGSMAGPINVGSAQSYLPQNMQQSGQQLGIQGSVGGQNAATGFQMPNMPNVGMNPNAFNTNQYYQKVFDAYNARQKPLLDQEKQQMQTQLANQGINVGTEAWKNSQDDLSRKANDQTQAAATAAYQNALGAQQQDWNQQMGANQLALGAQQQQYGQNLGAGQFYNQGVGQQNAQNIAQGQFGNQAQAQQYGQNLSGMGYGLQARGQDIGLGQANAGLQNQNYMQQLANLLQQHNQPYQDISNLMGMTSNQTPNFGATQPIDVTSPYALNQSQYNQQSQGQQAGMGGIFSILGNVAGSMPWGSIFGGG